MSIRIKTNLCIGALCSWAGLGYYRGTKQYDFENKRDMADYDQRLIEYNKHRTEQPNIICYKPIKPNKFYVTNIFYGLGGSIIYILPITGFVCAIKELYRLEINLRNLKEEKTTKSYNTVYP